MASTHEKDPEQGLAFLCLGTEQYDEPLVTLGQDGSVAYGPNYTPKAAAKAFWEVLGQYNPMQMTVDLLKTLAEGCPAHLAYRAAGEPGVSCEHCERVWEARQTLDAMEIL